MIDTTTLASLKRTIQVGDVLTMTHHDWFPTGKLIGLPRKVVHKQDNAIQFEGGSCLRWPEAKLYVPTSDGFAIILDDVGPLSDRMTYRVETNKEND